MDCDDFGIEFLSLSSFQIYQVEKPTNAHRDADLQLQL